MLIDAGRILKVPFVVLSFNKGSDHSILWTRIDLIPTGKKRILNVSNLRKRPAKINGKELMRRVEATDYDSGH